MLNKPVTVAQHCKKGMKCLVSLLTTVEYVLYLIHNYTLEAGYMTKQELLIEIHKHLFALTRDTNKANEWLMSHNKALDAKPIDLINNGEEGMIKVNNYLQSIRRI